MSSNETLPTIRIFVSSPGDVAEERNVALSTIRELQVEFQGRLQLIPILWEHMALLATAGFQEEIDRRVAPAETDIALFVLWSRLGTPLSRSFELDDGRRPTGTEWEFADAKRGYGETGTPHLLVYRKHADPITRANLPRDELILRSDEWAAVEGFFQRQFQNADDLSFTGSFHGFLSPAEFGQKLRAHLRQELGERLGRRAVQRTWHGSPFRGLEPFEAEHTRIFFGRRRAIEGVRQALARQVRVGRAFVLILGASGSGKSSLARAGLLPRLRGPWVVEEGVTGGFCRHAVMRPGDSTTPLVALAEAVMARDALPELASQGEATSLAEAWVASPQAAVNDVRGALARAAAELERTNAAAEPPPGRLVLLVDQLEELFTRDGLDAADRDALASVLDALARSGVVWILATLRSDFYSSLLEIGQLKVLRQGDGQYDLEPPDEHEIEEIVRLPVELAGLAYERDEESDRSLDHRILADARRGGDSLPLLQYALTRLEAQKVDQQLTFAVYDEMGGLEGAIGQQAERVWQTLDDESRAAFPRVLRTLVEVAEGDELRATARRARRSRLEAVPGAARFVQAFEDPSARLLVGVGTSAGPMIGVAHEALLRRWPRAIEQIAREADLLRTQTRLRSETARWSTAQRPTSWEYWRGGDLESALRLRHSGFDLEDAECEYLAAARRQTLRSRRIRRVAVSVIATLALGASLLAVFALRERGRADSRAAEATQRMLESFAAHGHAELLAGESLRAAPFLAAAYAGGLDDPALRFLLARACRPLDAAQATMVGHHALVESAAYSPDGGRAVTAGRDGTALVWDTQTGEPLARLEGHDGPVLSVAFDPEGARIVTAGEDKTARVWDANTGRPLVTLAGHVSLVESAVFSPDGSRIATASLDHTARLWDARSGATLHLLEGHTDCVWSANFSPDGRCVATASSDKTARVWDVSSGKPIALLSGHEGPVWSAVFDPGGTRLVTASDDHTARVWNAESGTLVATLSGHSEGVGCAVFDPRGERIATASGDRTARLWDARSGRTLAVLTGHAEAVRTVAFDPDGGRVVTASTDDTARVWNARTGEQLISLEGHADGVRWAGFRPDGQGILTASLDGTARSWRTDVPSTVVVLMGHTGNVLAADFGPGDARVVTASRDGTARVWDVQTGECLAPLAGHAGSVVDAAFSPDGGRVATAGWDGTARLWDARSGAPLATLEDHVQHLRSVVFSPNGEWLATASIDGKTRVWHIESGRLLATLTGHEDQVHAVAFGPHGALLATSSYDDSACLWETGTWRLRARLEGHAFAVWSVDFDREGTRLLTSSPDETARIWDTRSGELLAVLRGHRGAVSAAAFSPDGTRIATASWDDTARLWDGRNGAPLGTLEGHTADVKTVAFSTDGTRVVTASLDGTARIWDAHTGALLAILSGHAELVQSASFSADGTRVVTASRDGTARVWDVAPESRTPDEIDRLLRERCPYRLVGGRLVRSDASARR